MKIQKLVTVLLCLGFSMSSYSHGKNTHVKPIVKSERNSISTKNLLTLSEAESFAQNTLYESFKQDSINILSMNVQYEEEIEDSKYTRIHLTLLFEPNDKTADCHFFITIIKRNGQIQIDQGEQYMFHNQCHTNKGHKSH